MRNLTATLLAAQKKATATPYVKVEAGNKNSGVVRFDWTRLYTGSEDDYYHAVTMPGDGSLIRVRAPLPGDARKLYRQRVPDPGPSSDFSQWTYTNQLNAAAVACASLGAEVSICWIDGANRKIQRIKSTDYGVSWGSPEVIDYCPTINIGGLAAAYKPNGDLAIFFADQATLYVKKNISGQWQQRSSWNKSTGDLSGIAAVYEDDWNLLITGKDSSGNFKVWSLIYGDGGDVSAGSWSTLKELASAPSGGEFEYRQPFLDKPDVYRGFFVEKFTGSQSYHRPFWSHTVLDARFIQNLWREPVPFNLSSAYGLAIAHHGDYGWLSCPSGVWRAKSTVQNLDLTADVLAVRQEAGETSGKITVELRNDQGQYASVGQGELSVLDVGCQLEFSPGYRTEDGDEVSAGQTYCLEEYEHTSAGGSASLILYARDGWEAITGWRARHQFRWNRDSEEMSVKDILAFVLARVGLKLEVKSQSSVITGFYPDFTINSGNLGETVVRKLLSFVPDVLLVEGATACIVNPQASDSSVYSYGEEHAVLEGRYHQGAWELNRIQVEGYDTGSDEMIVVDRFSWGEIERRYDRLKQLEDRNIDSVTKAQERGDAYLRQAEVASASGTILVPVNCGQQLYDVIDITDIRAGLNAVKRRVLGFVLVYSPRRGEYRQRLQLGAV